VAQPGQRSTPAPSRLAAWRLGVLLAVAAGVLGMHGLAASSAACGAVASMTPSNRMHDAPSADRPPIQRAQRGTIVMATSFAGSSQAAPQRAGLAPQVACVATTPRNHQLMAPVVAVLAVAALAIWLSAFSSRQGRPRPPPGVDRSVLCVSLT
jgi:hypothetical protein